MAEISDPDPDPASIADHCADCERYIGTQGGGMDQAVCLMAEAGR
uniref:Uncharacterized protein n=1 Tax=Romanomermis culicivorax TaxID=13658 RepID=A0A915IT75_ROMCU